jgi:uncharacterized membrane protein YbhN (UPF0104 family)
MASTHDTTAELELPGLDVRALAKRAAPAAALAALIAVAVVVAGGPMRAFAHAFERALHADPRWVIAAIVFELASFGGYVALLWLVGRRASDRLGFRASLQITLGGAAATRLLPTAGVGGAALTMWALRRAGLGTRDAGRTLFAFLVVLYAVFLVSIATAGTLLALGVAHGDGPLALEAIPAAGAILAIAAALALGAFAHDKEPKAGASRLRTRLTDTGAVLGAGVRDAVAIVRSADPRLLGAVAWWTFDAAVLWAMLNAFGAAPAFPVLVLAYFVGQVGNTIPIPGAVSGGIVGLLAAFGVAPEVALVSVLAYRAVAIWLPAPIGLVGLSGLRKTIARWEREDAPAPAPVVAMPARPRAERFARPERVAA